MGKNRSKNRKTLASQSGNKAEKLIDLSDASSSSDEDKTPRSHAELPPQRLLQVAHSGPKSKRTRIQGDDDMDEDFAASPSSPSSSPSAQSIPNSPQ